MTREEAIEYLKRADLTVGQEIKTKTAEALEMAISALSENKGEWAENEVDGCIRYYCSKCGNCVSSFMNCSAFCPNCGADMRGDT